MELRSELCGKLLELVVEFGARLPDCFVRLHCAIGVDLDLNFLLERMWFLVASKPDPWILEELVSDNVAKGVVMVLDVDG